MGVASFASRSPVGCLLGLLYRGHFWALHWPRDVQHSFPGTQNLVFLSLVTESPSFAYVEVPLVRDHVREEVFGWLRAQRISVPHLESLVGLTKEVEAFNTPRVLFENLIWDIFLPLVRRRDISLGTLLTPPHLTSSRAVGKPINLVIRRRKPIKAL